MSDPFDYTELQGDATDLIREFGVSALLLRPATSGAKFNPEQLAPAEFPISVVSLNYKFYELNADVLATDRKLLVAVGDGSVAPKKTDKIELDGATLEIKNVDPLKPGDTILLWWVQGRA